MSTFVVRYCPPVLPLVVSWYATPSLPLSKSSASIVPGIMAGEPLKGPLDTGGGADADVMRAYWKFIPPVSNSSVICWTPAPSVAVRDTVVQFCHPPVAGIDTVCHTLLAVLKPTCIEAPPGEATRSCTT